MQIVIGADTDEPAAEEIAEMLSHYKEQTGVNINSVEVVIIRQQDYKTVFTTVADATHNHMSRVHERAGKGECKRNKTNRWR